jgi:hypothetical protein
VASNNNVQTSEVQRGILCLTEAIKLVLYMLHYKFYMDNKTGDDSYRAITLCVQNIPVVLKYDPCIIHSRRVNNLLAMSYFSEQKNPHPRHTQPVQLPTNLHDTLHTLVLLAPNIKACTRTERYLTND